MTDRSFPLIDVLSVLTMRRLSSNLQSMRNLLAYMRREGELGTQLSAALEQCQPVLLNQFPRLEIPMKALEAHLSTPTGRANTETLIAGLLPKLVAEYGDDFRVAPLSLAELGKAPISASRSFPMRAIIAVADRDVAQIVDLEEVLDILTYMRGVESNVAELEVALEKCSSALYEQFPWLKFVLTRPDTDYRSHSEIVAQAMGQYGAFLHVRPIVSNAKKEPSLLDEYLSYRQGQRLPDKAKSILFAVMYDLLDRSGFDGIWDGLSNQDREEILKTNLANIRKNLS